MQNPRKTRMLKYTEDEIDIGKLVEYFDKKSLLPNMEYQRGAAWKSDQKATFVDSVFRRYPVPAIFLHEISDRGLRGDTTRRWEIVDGQQRLIALRDFARNKFHTLTVEELRIPGSLRKEPAPWAGHRFCDLSPELVESFNERKLKVFLLADNVSRDEVRDLFIRLQSGTALSRQQVRDAWPGQLSDYVVSLAGKQDRKPRLPLFELLDMRSGEVDEDEHDAHVPSRQFCAQLLLMFLQRRRGRNFPPIGAGALDSLYHQYTDFDPRSADAKDFEVCVRAAFDTLKAVRELRNAAGEKKSKFTRAQIVAVFNYFVERQHRDGFDLRKSTERLTARLHETFSTFKFTGRMSPGALEKWYVGWKESVSDTAMLVESKRSWTYTEVSQIRTRDQGRCHHCDRPVREADEEIDFYPLAQAESGGSALENGRLVHWYCNRPGHPAGS